MTIDQLDTAAATFVAFQTGVSDDVEAAPLPPVVAWETLDAESFERELAQLCQWVKWLIELYGVGQDTISDCWYRHPALREELSHLRSAWLLTRHPNAGIGAIGVEWDRHRDMTLTRMRPLVARFGCTSSGHVEPAGVRHWQPAPADLARHIASERSWRDRAAITLARTQLAGELMDEVELRVIAADLVETNPTAESAKAELREWTELSPTRITAALFADTGPAAAAAATAAQLSALRAAHDRLLKVLLDPERDPRELTAVGHDWVERIEQVTPAEDAIAAATPPTTDSAAAGAAGRFPGIDDLLDFPDDQDV